MPQVAKAQTPATLEDVLTALIDGGAPTANAARMLAAQSALETAGWRAMWNWNLGNLTAASDASSWVQQSSSNSLHFLAYDSIQAGAADFVSYVARRGLLQYANVGDLNGYVAMAQRIPYCPGVSTEVYAAGMEVWLTRFGGKLPVPSAGTPLAYGALALGGGILALGALAWAADHGYIQTAKRWAHV